MKNIKIIFLFSVILSVQASAQITSNDSTLNGIESLYNNGQYLSAELEARRMYEQSDLNDSTKVQIEKWIAFSLIAQGKSSTAKERFVALFRIDDTFELDPILTSPKILSVFNDARAKYLSQKKNISYDSLHTARRQQADHPSISFRTIIFPGWEQFHQGREKTGYVFSGAGAVTFASGIVFEMLRANAREEYLKAKTSTDISSKYTTYNSYRKAEIYSFAAFAVVCLASEIEVFTQSDVALIPEVSIKNGGQMHLIVRF